MLELPSLTPGSPSPSCTPQPARSPQQPGQKRPAGREYLSPAPGARHTVNAQRMEAGPTALGASVCPSVCHMG